MREGYGRFNVSLVFPQNYRMYSLDEYRKIGAKRYREVFETDVEQDEKTVEREFWNTVTTSPNFTVQYANDVEGSAVRQL
jgi:hypothetical protein